jgi:hypothetical protein
MTAPVGALVIQPQSPTVVPVQLADAPLATEPAAAPRLRLVHSVPDVAEPEAPAPEAHALALAPASAAPLARGGCETAWGVWTVQLHPGLHRTRSRVVAASNAEARLVAEANLHRRVGKWIIDPFTEAEPW